MEGVLKCVVQHGRAHVPNRSASTSPIGSKPRAKKSRISPPSPCGSWPKAPAPEYPGERNLRGLRKLIATPKKTLQELLTRMYDEASSDFVKETVGVFITMPEDTFSSVHSTAAKDTQWLSLRSTPTSCAETRSRPPTSRRAPSTCSST